MSELYNKAQVNEIVLHLANEAKAYIEKLENNSRGYNSDFGSTIKTTRTFVSANPESSTRQADVYNLSYTDVIGVKAFYELNGKKIFDTSNVATEDSFSISTVENAESGVLVKFTDIGINAQDKTITLIVDYENQGDFGGSAS